MTKKVIVLLITLVLVLGVVSTAWAQVPSNLTSLGDPLSYTISAGTQQIKLSWVQGKEPPQSAYLGTTYTVGVQAQNLGEGPIDRVLYIVEIEKDGKPVTPVDLEIIGHDDRENKDYTLVPDSMGYIYWGPSSGFTFPGATDPTKGILTATFKVTFKTAGTYTFTIYAVQLPATT